MPGEYFTMWGGNERSDFDSEPQVLDADEWLNSPPLTDEDLRGQVLMVEVFQMLCPRLRLPGLPQTKRVRRAFRQRKVMVLGLHSVFAHHEAMTPVALKAFLHEYSISYPVAIDRAEPGNRIPATMRRYRLEGIPTTILAHRQSLNSHESYFSL